MYSHLKFGFPEHQAQAVCQCLHDLGMPLWDPTLNQIDVILGGLEEFRQHLGGRLTITMLRDVANPFDVHDIDLDVMGEAIGQLYIMANNLTKNSDHDLSKPALGNAVFSNASVTVKL
jgi:3-dehydroquinate synthase